MRFCVPFLAGCFFLSSCSGPYSNLSVAAKATAPVLAVRTERIESQIIPEIVSASGELAAEESATISAKVPGRVAKLHVDLGSKVEAGAVLAELEREDYEFLVKEAEAQVQQTRYLLGLRPDEGDTLDPARTATVRQAAATLEEARLTFERSKQLTKEGVVSRMEFDRVQANLQLSEARQTSAVQQVYELMGRLVERRAQLALARQRLADTYIRAPFPGAITRRIASLGEYLGLNAPIVTLVRSHPLRLRLDVPERLASKVLMGQRIDVTVEGQLTNHFGKVVRISPAIEAQSRSLTIEGEIPNADGALRAGSFAEGVITVNPSATGVSAPQNGLSEFAGVFRVWVVNGDALEERIVRPGRKLSGGRIEILSGLKSGERIASQASEKFANGIRVRPEGM